MNHSMKQRIGFIKRYGLFLLALGALFGCGLTYQAKVQNNYFIVVPNETPDDGSQEDSSGVTFVKIRKVSSADKSGKIDLTNLPAGSFWFLKNLDEAVAVGQE